VIDKFKEDIARLTALAFREIYPELYMILPEFYIFHPEGIIKKIITLNNSQYGHYSLPLFQISKDINKIGEMLWMMTQEISFGVR
jgi:hypothetical protein